MPKRPRKQVIKKNIGRKKQPGNTSLTDPVTRPEARQQAKAAARSEYGPVVRETKKNIRASRSWEQQVGQWFNTLGAQEQQAAAATDASYGQANAQVQANIDAATKAAQANQGMVASQDASFAALTGADASSFAPTQQAMGAATQQRALTGSMLAAPIAAAGAGQAAFQRNRGINARREGIQQKLTESKRRSQIKQDLTAARKERAQKAQANFGEIRDKERDFLIQQRAFPLERQAAAADAAQAAADDRRADRALAETERHNRQTENDDEQGGLTPSERNDARQGRKGAVAAASNLIKANGVPKSPREWAGLQALLEDKEEISPTEAAYAIKKMKARARKKSAAKPPEIDAPSPLG